MSSDKIIEKYALVDCNNFYVSCERVFNPKLVGKAVVVLSNNDGCVISRSNEAKEMGVAMGAPFFRVSHLIKEKGLVAQSSNYALYGDMSARVMKLLAEYAPRQEVYSIDESFLLVGGMPDFVNTAKALKETVQKHLGLPICVGIAPTKTLAKLSNGVAKSSNILNGVLDYSGIGEVKQNRLLKALPVKNVWGVGRKLAEKFSNIGIETAYDLRESDADQMGKSFSVVVKRTILELRGTACIDMESGEQARKSIGSSRSFGRAVTSLEDLEEAVTSYALKACEKLRRDHSVAAEVQVMVTTSAYAEDSYSNAGSASLQCPTDDSMIIVKHALLALRQIYQAGHTYQAGVMLGKICSGEGRQISIFDSVNASEKSTKMMQALDATNGKWGRGTIFLASEGIGQDWKMKAQHKSPAYTSNWGEIAKVKSL